MMTSRKLVCGNCWDACFSTEEFRALCQRASTKDAIHFVSDSSSMPSPADRNCEWCTLIRQLDEESKEIVPAEFRESSNKSNVLLRSGIFDESYTPLGNNRFTLSVNGVSAPLTAFTPEKSFISDIVTARPILTDVASDLAFEQINQWLENCTLHPECGPLSMSALPTRVIDVSAQTESGTARLLSTQGVPGKYAALSYCWGGKQVGLTTKANLASRLQTLDPREVSKTVREAIWTTQRLGIQYLWVDAICIIQDSEDDKAEEIRKMCDIYRKASVTIVAANAAHSEDGFLHCRPQPSPPIEIPFWSAGGKLTSVLVRMEGWYDDDSEPINSRGWTLQERLLSRRLIIFASHTVQLQCKRDIVNVGNSLNIPCGGGTWRLPSVLSHPFSADAPTNTLSIAIIMEAWKTVITIYSRRRLKYVEDRLIALGGLAQAFHELIKAPYLAGLWSGQTLPAMLLWEPSHDSAVTNYQSYVAPSWSWASIPCPISFRNSHKMQDMEPFKVEVISSTTSPVKPLLVFGKVSAGRIILKAHTKIGKFVPPDSLEWEELSGPPPRRPRTPSPGLYDSNFILPDIKIYARLDHHIPNVPEDVVCLALALRSYVYEGIRYSAVDGLLIGLVPDQELPNVYKRIGCFYGAMEEEFDISTIEQLILV